MYRDIEPSLTDRIDAALEAESRARSALIAVGEQWKVLQEMGREPTDDELALHPHLVQRWREAAEVLAGLLEMPVDQQAELEEPSGG